MMVIAGIGSLIIGCTSIPSISEYNSNKQAKINTQTFETLIQNNELKEAAAHYEKYSNDIQKSEQGKELTAQLAEKIKLDWNPKLININTNLTDITKNFPINDHTQWLVIKEKLQEAKLTIESIKKNTILNQSNSASQWDEFANPTQTYTKLSESIENNLKDSFNAFNQSNEDFFKVYPLTLDDVSDKSKADIQSQIFPIIQQKMSKSKKLEDSTSQLHRYGQYLNQGQRRTLVLEWTKQYAKSKSWKMPLSTQRRMEALQHLTKDTNLSSDDLINTVYVPVNIKDQKLISELSKKVGSNLLSPIEPSSIAATVKNMEKDNLDFIVFIHSPGQEWGSKITGKTAEAAQFIAHEEKKQNPELQSLRDKLARAQQSLVSARQSAALSQSTNTNTMRQGGGMALLGALAQGFGVMAVTEAERDVQRTQNELNSAPAIISTPVYQNYQRQKVTRKNQISLPIHILIFDTEAKRYYTLSNTLSKEHEFSYTDQTSVKARDKNPPEKIDLIDKLSAFSSDFNSKELQQYSLNISHLITNDKKKEMDAKKVNEWSIKTNKNSEDKNNKLLSDLQEISKKLSTDLEKKEITSSNDLSKSANIEYELPTKNLLTPASKISYCKNGISAYCQARMEGQRQKPLAYTILSYDQCTYMAEGWANSDFKDPYWQHEIQKLEAEGSRESLLNSQVYHCYMQVERTVATTPNISTKFDNVTASENSEQTISEISSKISNSKIVAPVNECVKLSPNGKYSTWINNICSFPIRVMHCYPNIQGANTYHDVRSAECKRFGSGGISSTGGTYIKALGRAHVSSPGNNSRFHLIACRNNDDSQVSGPNNVIWKGSSLSGNCYTSTSTPVANPTSRSGIR